MLSSENNFNSLSLSVFMKFIIPIILYPFFFLSNFSFHKSNLKSYNITSMEQLDIKYFPSNPMMGPGEGIC